MRTLSLLASILVVASCSSPAPPADDNNSQDPVYGAETDCASMVGKWEAVGLYLEKHVDFKLDITDNKDGSYGLTRSSSGTAPNGVRFSQKEDFKLSCIGNGRLGIRLSDRHGADRDFQLIFVKGPDALVYFQRGDAYGLMRKSADRGNREN